MKRWLLGLGAVGLALLCFVSCEQVNLPPDVYVSWVKPLAYYVSESRLSIDSMSVCIKARNSVDSYLDNMQWEYYDQNRIQLGTTSSPFSIYAPIPGKRDTGTTDSAIIMGIGAPVQQLVAHMVANNQNSGSVRFIFTARNQYNEDETDTASCYVGLYRIFVYNFTLKPVRDSVMRGDTVTILARLDSLGIGIAGEQVTFSVDLGCTLTPYQQTTDNLGYAKTLLRAGSTADTATVTALTRKAGAKQTTVIVK